MRKNREEECFYVIVLNWGERRRIYTTARDDFSSSSSSIHQSEHETREDEEKVGEVKTKEKKVSWPGVNKDSQETEATLSLSLSFSKIPFARNTFAAISSFVPESTPRSINTQRKRTFFDGGGREIPGFLPPLFSF